MTQFNRSSLTLTAYPGQTRVRSATFTPETPSLITEYSHRPASPFYMNEIVPALYSPGVYFGVSEQYVVDGSVVADDPGHDKPLIGVGVADGLAVDLDWYLEDNEESLLLDNSGIKIITER